MQQIVGDAKVSKPTLYYYFTDKADLFQALVNEAHDERYRRMQSAVKRAKEVRLQLVEILAVLFDYFRDNRELMRISLATAFASPGELPPGFNCSDRCERNFELVHAVIKQRSDPRRTGRPVLTAASWRSVLAGELLSHDAPAGGPETKLDRAMAGRIVDLFYSGAGAKPKLAKKKSLSRKSL